MFGLGFLNSFFLFALAAMALPIIIHILNRRRLRKIRFSSLEFIDELSRRRMSRVNLRRWIVLLLRTLAVTFVVLAFARPTLHSRAALFMPAAAAKQIVICVDMSASMGVERETGTAFTQAKILAKRVVDESARNDVLNVVASSGSSRLLFESGTTNKQIVKKAIDGLEVADERASLTKALETAVGHFRESELRSGEIYVVSDFRETADSLLVSGTPAGLRVILLPVYLEAVDNVSIDRVFTPRKLIRPGEVVRVGVSVTNHSRENPAEFPVELFIDEKRKAEKFVNLSPAASATVTFSVSINDWGSHRCRVAKNRDRLPIDDDRFFMLDVSRRIPVTLMRGKRFVEDDKQTASYFYVDKALNPRGSGESEFSVKVVDEKDLTTAALPDRGVVVWTDPHRLDRNRFELLKRYLHTGGRLMVFLGGGSSGQWREDGFARYFGIKKATHRKAEESLRSFQKDHPVFSIFNEEELELLSRSRVREYIAVAGVAPDSILAYLGSGDAGIWECRRGDGRAVVVSASPDMASGDLPLSPMFLPLIHTTVSYLASSEGAEFHRENYPGTDLFFDLPAGWRRQGHEHRVANELGEQEQAVFFDLPHGETKAMISRPKRVGFYKLLADTTLVSEAVVNVDTRESNLNPQELAGEYLGDATVVDDSADFATTLQRERQGREIYPLFLLVAISALVLESLLGRRA
ncbi:MAG: BatA domain-containing protein [Candidatus Krumholzibacteria bacterium]|nr:BatA domain-containing protein [Candidatus Krumholzibacteria bacterium]